MRNVEAIECLKEISGVYTMGSLAGDKESEKKLKALLFAIERLEGDEADFRDYERYEEIDERMERLEVLLRQAIDEVLGM